MNTAMNNESFAAWCDQALVAIRRLPARASLRYESPDALAHYHRVAEELRSRTGDEELALAGFLHGLPVSLLPSLRIQGTLLSELVETVLVDRERLRDTDYAAFVGAPLAYDDPRLLRLSLGRLRSGGSAVLLILEQLDHLDPGGDGRRWLASFYADPTKAGPVPVLPKVLEGRGSIESQLAFVESFVAYVAGYFGFQTERRYARDLVALHRDRQAIERVRAFIAESHTVHSAFVCDTLVALQHDHPEWRTLETRWTWRHLQSCMEELGPDRTTWPKRLGQCGFATMVVPDKTTAYAALSAVHGRFPAHHAGFRDYFSRTMPADYRALHTAVAVQKDGDVVRLNVRMLPPEGDVKESEDDRLRVLARTGRVLDGAFDHADSIVVYTPTLDVKHLPKDSCILDFAYSINSRWIARVNGATINGRETTDLFTPLQHGDTVALSMLPMPRFLMNNWWTYLPEEKRRSRRDNYAAAVAPLLLNAGRAVIRQMLDDANLRHVPEHMIETLVTVAAARGRSRSLFTQNYTAHEWLRQLGLLQEQGRAKNDGLDVPGLIEIDHHRVMQLKRLLIEAIDPSPEISLSRQQRQQITNIVNCRTCEPDLRMPVVGVIRDGVLYVHRPACDDGRDGEPLDVHQRIANRQYVVIDTSNRSGLLADIAAVLRRRNVDIIEVIGQRRSPVWGTIRLELDCASGPFIDELVRVLERIPGVNKVLGPDADPNPLLELEMPPRREGTLTTFGTNPIVRGTPVTTDEQFYGRKEELKRFMGFVHTLIRPDQEVGQMVLVLGPLQTGKTSFVLKCIRDLDATQLRPYVMVYLEAGEGETWSAYERRLLAALQKKADLVAARWGKARVNLDGLDFAAAVRCVREWAGTGAVIIAVDEVRRLMEATSKSGSKEYRPLNAAFTACRGTPGVMMVLSGPKASLKGLNKYLMTLLDSRAQFINLPPFGESEVKQIVHAVKLPWAYRVKIDRPIWMKIIELCAGDPLWTSALAYELWELALRDHPPQVVRLTDEALVKQAVQALLVDRACFDLRFRFLKSHHGRPYRDATEKLLRRLGAEPETSTRTVAQLAAELSLLPDHAGKTLDLLAQAGLVKANAPEDGRETSYRIAAPLLAQYLKSESRLLD
jgi:hypothetical protein